MNFQETEYKSYEVVQIATGMFRLKLVYKFKFRHDYAKLLVSLERSKTLRIADGRFSKIYHFVRDNVSECDPDFREELRKEAAAAYRLAVSNLGAAA